MFDKKECFHGELAVDWQILSLFYYTFMPFKLFHIHWVRRRSALLPRLSQA